MQEGLFSCLFLYAYVHGCCGTKEDNNVIVVLQRQFISHLDRIKSTKHNNNTPYSRFYIFFLFVIWAALFCCWKKTGWNRYCTTRYPNNILAAAVISTIQRNRYKIKTFLVSKRKTYTSFESICYLFQDNIIWYLSS